MPNQASGINGATFDESIPTGPGSDSLPGLVPLIIHSHLTGDSSNPING